MNGIEKITGQIDADLQKELDDLKAQTQTRAAEITAGYDRQAQELTQSILERGRREADLRRERLDSVAQLEARKLTLSAKQEMVARAFDLALQKLTELPEADYIALLARLAPQFPRAKLRLIPFRAVGVESGLLLALRCRSGRREILVAVNPDPVGGSGPYEALLGGASV